jgi:REP element-mobilizing transposase RayT
MVDNNHICEAGRSLVTAPVFLKDAGPEMVSKRKGRYLPHWTLENGIYHARFRLFDSLPAKIRNDLAVEKEALYVKIHNPASNLTIGEKKKFAALYTENVEKLIDAGHGACWLKEDPIAEIVVGVLNFFNDQRYKLYSWCIMPNHVHVIVQPLGGFKLEGILKSWKAFSAHRANILLKRTGQFWLYENFDRLIRSEDDLQKKIHYVISNPIQAGLGNWKWVGK